MSDHLSEGALRRLLSLAADDDAALGTNDAIPLLPERYEFIGELGRGGMGIVYECHDRTLDRRCAVKTISAGAGADAGLRRRFAHEAQAAARLRHPHIADVYDATEDYISMRLVHGSAVDAGEPLDVRSYAGLVRDAARALHRAHIEGIIHRDVKPSNLLVENGHVFVVDFGLAKALDHDVSISLAGSVVGTPSFMAPEQALGGSVDGRADVYGLGATLFACVRKQPPFAADDLPTLLRQVVDQDAPRLGADRDLDVVVAKCLHKDIGQRYASAGELADDLERWLAQEPIRARPPSLGYRLQKRLQRQRTLWRAAGIAALLTALVLVPIALRESAARQSASEAVALADHASALVQEAELLSRLGDTVSAREILDRGIVRVREFLSRNEVPRARYLLSRLLRVRGKREEAIVEAGRALAADPLLTDARFERGLLLAALPQLSDEQRRTAMRDLEVGVGERSALTSADRMFGQGELLRLGGEHEQAMDLLRGVLEYDQSNIDARISLSKVALALGNSELAQYYASSAFDLQRGFGSFFVAQQQMALPTSIFGLLGAPVDYSKEMKSGFDSDLATAFRGLVNLRRALRLHREGATGDAVAAARTAIEDHDAMLTVHAGLPGAINNRGVCRLALAGLLTKQGDVGGAAETRRLAIADFRAALAVRPLLAEAHCNLGIATLRLAKLLRAMGRLGASRQQLLAARSALQAALQLRGGDDSWPHQRLCRTQLEAVEAAGG